MIYGIGCDIVKINRIKTIYKVQNNKFINRILSPFEQEHFYQLDPHNIDVIVRYLSKRYAAKEALAKSLGTGIGKIAFNQIEICNSVQGQPYFSHNTMNIVQNITQSKLTGHLSISDEKNIAMAFTILEINL